MTEFNLFVFACTFFRIFDKHDPCLWAVFSNQLHGHLPVEGPDLLRGGDDLILGQDESVLASVPELHCHGVLDVQFTKGPVNGATSSRVEHAWDTADIVDLAVDGKEILIGLKRFQKCTYSI